LGNANLAVELLTTTDQTRARILAIQLEGMNDQRKILVDQVTNEALAQIKETPSLAEYNGLVLAAQNWHPGVVGIAASRLVDQFGKPTILISLTQHDNIGRGSARSVPGCDIHKAIKTQADLLLSFGGHPMAAGLALSANDVIAFRRGLSDALANCQGSLEKDVRIDAFIPLEQISVDLLNTIQRLAPFGNGNPPVMLACREVEIVSETIFGKQHEHKRVVIADNTGHQQEVIWWRGVKENAPQGKFDLAFTIGFDDYKGGVQVEWQTVRQLTTLAMVTGKPEFIDWQQHRDVTSEIKQQNLSMIWGEGVSSTDLTLLPRHKIQPDDTLVIWTVPPDENIYQQAMKLVQPQRVFLVGQHSPFDSLPAFMRQLMGLIKYAMQHKNGQIEWETLVAVLGHTLATVRLGIDWLVAQGKLSSESINGGLLKLQPAQQSANLPEATEIEKRLKTALAETVAYREFFRSTFGKR
jgi:single-stranded-DNA-specific exonuclease